jgi:hypothetical protein
MVTKKDLDRIYSDLYRRICSLYTKEVLSFPENPRIGKSVVLNGILYFWDGANWVTFGSGSGGSGNTTIPFVNTYTLLPAAASHIGELYYVRNTVGSDLKGGYVSDGTMWSYISTTLPTPITFSRYLNYSALPTPATHAGEYVAVENSQGTQWLPGTLGGTYYPKGFYYSDGSIWIFSGELPINATQSEVDLGIDNTKFVTSLTLANYYKWGLLNQIKDQEELTGVKNGINLNFSIINVPILNSEHIYLNGQRLRRGSDYSILNNNIIFNFNIYPDDVLFADYRF